MARVSLALLVVALSMPTLAPAADIPVPAKSHVLKPDRVSKITIKPQAKGAIFALPSPGGASDPTITGASIAWCRFDSPDECQAFVLPPENWQGIGSPPGSKGYKYTGAGSSHDPCKVIVLRRRAIKATCKRADLSTPVGEAGVGWEITLGADRYCAESSEATLAVVKRNDSKTWKAVNADAPSACPVPHCGNGVVDGTEECDGGSHCTPSCTFIPNDPNIACCLFPVDDDVESCFSTFPDDSACFYIGGSNLVGATCVTTPDPCPGEPWNCEGTCDLGATFPEIDLCCQGPLPVPTGSCYDSVASSSSDLAAMVSSCGANYGEDGVVSPGVCAGTICVAVP